MERTKIDWCDSTWDPVTGCLHGCKYCYARGIAKRFSYERATLDAPLELQRIWITEVFTACKTAPQHNYFFLTKNVSRYAVLGELLPDDDNMWYGISITKESEVHDFNSLPAFRNTFVSIEPLLEDLCVE